MIKEKRQTFNFEEFLFAYRYPLIFVFLGLILIGFGIIYYKNSFLGETPKVEVLEWGNEVREGEDNTEIIVEVSGAVEKPGVYKLVAGSRVEDLLIAAGGISASADRDWMDRMVNRAAKLTDGQKIYIPSKDELAPRQDYQSSVRGAKNSRGEVGSSGGIAGLEGELVNINSSSQKELEELPGIGPVYAQSIIEHRPYSSVEELLSKGALKKHVYEKIKDRVSVY